MVCISWPLTALSWDIYWTTSVAPKRIWTRGGGKCLSQSADKFPLSYTPLFWLYKYNQSFWWALSWWAVQFGQFLVCCSTQRCPPCPANVICKSGGTCPCALCRRRYWTN